MNQIYIPYVNPIYLKENMRGTDDDRDTPCTSRRRLTRAYVPRQPYMKPYPMVEGLKKGTIFPNLDIPYPIKSKE